MSFYFLLCKNWKTFIPLLVISSLFALFELKFRREMLGATIGYGDRYIPMLLSSPLSTIWKAVLKFSFIDALKIFYPFLIPLGLIFKTEFNSLKDLKSSFITPALLLMAPLLFLHFLANKFHFQYGAQFGSIMLGIVIFSKYFDYTFNYKKLQVLTIILFIGSSIGTYTKLLKKGYRSSSDKCIATYEKAKSTAELLTKVSSIPIESSVLATGGVIPRVLQPGMQIFHWDGFSKRKQQYNYILLELNNSGDTYPISRQEVKSLSVRCAMKASDIIIKDKFYLFAAGPFRYNCL